MAKKNTTTKKFEDMTVTELLQLCESFGISVSKRAKKAQIIEILKTSSTATEATKEKAEAAKKGEKTGETKKRRSSEPTGKEIGRKEQLKIRSEKIESAGKIYSDSIEDTMHSMDRITPKVYKNKPKIHTVRPEDAWKKRELDEEELALAQSFDDPFYTLTGTIEGIGNTERLQRDGRDVTFAYIVVDYKGKTVRIPSYHFFADYTENIKKYSADRLYSMLQHRIGSEVDFNMIHQDIDGITGRPRYYGTRLLASKIKRCDVWYGKMEDGSWYVNDGDEIEARIVEIWPKTIIVEVSGAEAIVPLKEVTRRYISNIEKQTDYKTGDIVKVKVSDIKRKDLPDNIEGFSFPVEYKASIKEAEPDPQKIFFNDFDINDTRRAVVTNIESNPDGRGDSNQFYCQIINKPVVVKCVLVEGAGRNGHLPKIDQEVRIRIRKKDPKKFFIYGEIIRVVEDRSKSETAFTVKA